MSSGLDYQLLTKLHEGAASAAWLGRKLDSGANALVRVFHGTLWRRPDARGHFVDRAEALQSIMVVCYLLSRKLWRSSSRRLW